MSRVRSINNLASLPPILSRKKEHIATAFDDIDIYIYHPLQKQCLYPLYVNIHGGGFMMNSAMHDEYECRLICNRLGAIVLNIDYTLAPEARFPVQLEQCYGAILWVIEQAQNLSIDLNKIIIGGHSAGANLAITCTLLGATRNHFKALYLVVLCPYIDLATEPSMKKVADDRLKIIPDEAARHFIRCYLNEQDDPKNYLISPVYSTAPQLALLPPATVITAGSDNLWPEGAEFASKLGRVNNHVSYLHFPHMVHSFLIAGQGPKKQSAEAWDYVTSNIEHWL